MAKKMFHFIVLIRALAAMIITNAHYTGVYPTDLVITVTHAGINMELAS